MYEYCALDFETTGLQAAGCDVIEYGAVQYGRDGLGPTLDSLCRPHRSIPSEATMVNGITDKMVAQYPCFEDQLEQLLTFIGDRTVVCHNAPFDMSFLNRYCRTAQRQPPGPVLDTLSISRRLIRQLPGYSLKTVAHFLKVPQPSAHRALADALVTAQIHRKLMDLSEL